MCAPVFGSGGSQLANPQLWIEASSTEMQRGPVPQGTLTGSNVMPVDDTFEFHALTAAARAALAADIDTGSRKT